MMLSPVILIFAAFLPINQIYCTPRLNIDDLLDIIEQKQKIIKRAMSSESSSNSDASDDNDDGDKTLRGRELVHFFQQSLDDNKNRKLTKNKHLSELYSYLANANGDRHNRYFADKDEKPYVDKNKSRQMNQLVQYLLSQNVQKQQRVLGKEATLTKNREEGAESPDEYSRIYIILNPEVLESDQNQKKLTALVSGLTSKLSGSKNDLLGQYKGFPIKSSLVQRRRRDSMEAGKDSDDGYSKPKRQRYSNSRGRDSGRAGGGGGRTAIPYIRQRGDIYERDS